MTGLLFSPFGSKAVTVRSLFSRRSGHSDEVLQWFLMTFEPFLYMLSIVVV